MCQRRAHHGRASVHCAHTKCCKSCGTFHPWPLTTSTRRLRRLWKRPTVRYPAVPSSAHRPFNIIVSGRFGVPPHRVRGHGIIVNWCLFIVADNSMGSTFLSSPDILKQLGTPESSSGRIIDSVYDPMYQNYARMERKYKMAMRKVRFRIRSNACFAV